MFRRGKQEGWLSLALDKVPSMCRLYGVSTSALSASMTTNRGVGLVALRKIGMNDNPVVKVPHDVVLSKEYVWQRAKADQRLQQILNACGDFAQVRTV